jgi:hypothetical protein
MSGTADRSAHAGRRWREGHWQEGDWNDPWHRRAPPGAGFWDRAPGWARHGGNRALWIAAMVLGFIAFWPIGLALLFYLIWSGRMGCWNYRQDTNTGRGSWAWTPPRFGWCGRDRAAPPPASSGNRAFDEYRAETLRRLEEEQRDFGAFLERLRYARDKAEFDQFMAELRQRGAPPAPPAEPA